MAGGGGLPSFRVNLGRGVFSKGSPSFGNCGEDFPLSHKRLRFARLRRALAGVAGARHQEMRAQGTSWWRCLVALSLVYPSSSCETADDVPDGFAISPGYYFDGSAYLDEPTLYEGSQQRERPSRPNEGSPVARAVCHQQSRSVSHACWPVCCDSQCSLLRGSMVYQEPTGLWRWRGR